MNDSEPSKQQHRQNAFKSRIQPKIVNQKLVLDSYQSPREELSPKNKFSNAARALKFIDNSLLKPLRDTPPKLELKIKDRDTSNEGLKYQSTHFLFIIFHLNSLL